MKCANPECDKLFTKLVGDQVIHNKLFCSKKCGWKVKNRRRTLKNKSYYKIKCSGCSVVFTADRSNTKYCSCECQERTWQSKNKVRYYARKKEWTIRNPDKILEKRIKYTESGRQAERKRGLVSRLSNGYLSERLGIKNAPPELIEIKRLHIKLHRTLKQLNP